MFNVSIGVRFPNINILILPGHLSLLYQTETSGDVNHRIFDLISFAQCVLSIYSTLLWYSPTTEFFTPSFGSAFSKDNNVR